MRLRVIRCPIRSFAGFALAIVAWPGPAAHADEGGVSFPPEIAYWERGEWWLAGDARPWQPDAVNVLSDKLVFTPRLTSVAGRDLWHP